MFGFCGICGRISGVRQCTKSCPTLVTPWTVACQAPLSMRFSRQEYWSGLPSPSPGDFFFLIRLKMYFNKFRLHYFISKKNFKGIRDKIKHGTPIENAQHNYLR